MITLRVVRPAYKDDRVKKPRQFPETHIVQNRKGSDGVSSLK